MMVGLGYVFVWMTM